MARTVPHEILTRAGQLDDEIAFFERFGFRLVEIRPADDPREALIVRDNLALRLVVGHAGSTTIVLSGTGEAAVSPSENRIEWRLASIERPVIVPALVTVGPETDWTTGRAGMLYRDLVPGRLGDAVIASHIRIPNGGPVPDYEHHHEILFQLIHCHRGWVKVVYEGQGDPFVLHPGDLVIQPPGIRHRVLEASDEMHVVEIGWPAEHATRPDPEVELPGPSLPAGHTWNGQRFVRHVARARDGATGVVDTGVGAATDDLARSFDVHLSANSEISQPGATNGTFDFWFVDSGRATFGLSTGENFQLVEGSSLVVPPGVDVNVRSDTGAQLLHVLVDTSRAG